MPTPDTSPRNIAFALRRAVSLSASDYDRVMDPPADRPSAIRAQCLALADALEQTGSNTDFQGALTWDERIARAHEAVNDNDTKPDWLEITLRAAFPELAPSDD